MSKNKKSSDMYSTTEQSAKNQKAQSVGSGSTASDVEIGSEMTPSQYSQSQQSQQKKANKPQSSSGSVTSNNE